jgi:hypothetical protein
MSSTADATQAAPTAPKPPEHNTIGLDYRRPMPRPKVRGDVIDGHCHLFAARHADVWFEAADHYGIDRFVTQTPLEEALALQTRWGHRLQFVVTPRWPGMMSDFNVTTWLDDWFRRIEAFHNLGSRILKLHLAPQSMQRTGLDLDSEPLRRVLKECRDRGMVIMTHLGDPETWYQQKYTDHAIFGTREAHYAMWERALSDYKDWPWLGAHLGGNPEDLPRLQRLLDTYPNLYMDLSATRWMVREVSARRDEARDFVIRNASRLIWGSDQVSGDTRDFDFLASRFWCHRKLWETTHAGPTPIFDPDLPPDRQPRLQGLALPDETIQSLYRDTVLALLKRVGVNWDWPIDDRAAA